MHELYFATGNPVKFQEVQSFFNNHFDNQIVVKQFAKEIDEIQSFDQKVVAIEKGRAAWQKLRKPVLVDDAGIFFDKYHQFPGTMSKFVHKGLGMENVLRLVEEGDKASFQITIVYYYDENQYQLFNVVCRGTITKPKEFCAFKDAPYDDIFVPEESDKPFVALRDLNQLEHYNYRTKALEKFAKWYSKKESV